MRHGMSQSFTTHADPKTSVEQRRACIFVLALSLVLFIQSSPTLEKLSGEEWLAILPPPLLLIAEWPRWPSPGASRSASDHGAAQLTVDREQTRPTAEAPAGTNSPALAATWQRDVNDLAQRYPSPFRFTVSPLVYAPDEETAVIIEACFPADSMSDETRMQRNVILMGQARYHSEPSPASQKGLARDVMRDIEAMYATEGKPSPVRSIDICCRILAGTYVPLRDRLAGLKPSQPDLL